MLIPYLSLLALGVPDNVLGFLSQSLDSEQNQYILSAVGQVKSHCISAFYWKRKLLTIQSFMRENFPL